MGPERADTLAAAILGIVLGLGLVLTALNLGWQMPGGGIVGLLLYLLMALVSGAVLWWGLRRGGA